MFPIRRNRTRWTIITVCVAIVVSTALIDSQRSPLHLLDRRGRAVATDLLDRIGGDPISVRSYRIPSGRTVDFEIEIRGLRLDGGRVRMSESESGAWSVDRIPILPPPDQPVRSLLFDPQESAIARVDTSAGLRGPSALERVWFRDKLDWVDGVIVSLPLTRYEGEPLPWTGEQPEVGQPVDLELRFDPIGRLLSATNRLLNSGRSGRGLVFDPNPVAVSGQTDLRDGDPVDDWRVEVDLERLDGTGRLRGERVRVDTGSGLAAEEPLLRFDYPSNDPHFEEVMAYYHIDRTFSWLEQLGFGDLFERAQRVTVHATPLDNSWYSPLTQRIEFGDGGVDDAEDADIILHEFAHAIHDAFVPGFGDGDTRAISEGFADYIAATRTGDPCVGNWDATSYSPPCLRTTEQRIRYTGTLSGRSHIDGQIWSGALWAIREELGPSITDPIVLEGLIRQSRSSRLPEAANALVEAAAALGFDSSIPAITSILADRGLIQRVGTFQLHADETMQIPLDRSWPAAPEASHLTFRGDGSVEIGEGLDLLPFRDRSGASVQIRYRADADGFVCEWERPTSRGVASGTLRLAADGSLDLVWGGEPAAWPDGEVGLLVGSEPPWEVEPESLFETDSFPNSFLSRLQAGAGVLSGGRLVLRRQSAGWAVEDRFRPPSDRSRPVLQVLGNPSAGETSIRLDLPFKGPVDLSVYDLSGRLVRRLLSGVELPTGPHRIGWDGRDRNGSRAATGVYWLRLESNGDRTSRRIVRIGP